jgi:ABC-2 type transport system permease protein/oleandomycin transport system permease protein
MSTITVTPRSRPRPAAASRATAALTGVAAAFSDTADVAWRNLRTLFRTPQALVFATIQPVIFVLLFRYAFGGAIHVPGTNYVDFLMPGIFAQTVAFGAIGTAIGLSADLRTGILVRFRTLPMAPIAVLGGRTLADLARNLLVVAVMAGVGFAAGFRSTNGAGGLFAALGLVVAFGYALSWGFAALGLRVSDPEAAQAAGVPVVFLLVFTASAFVPATAMPGWLQAFGTHQPVNALVSAERALTIGGPAAHDVLISVAWSGGMLLVFALVAARTYARMGR